jgi:hypothetical protein
MQHRIFLAPIGSGVSWAEAQAHWRSHHETIMLGLPHLLGYVQNRPTEDWWIHLPYLACSETWFADRERETAAYATDWYREQIAVDEGRMFGRDDAWSSPVLATETLHEGMTGRYRTLAFGADPAHLDAILFDGRAEVLRLHRAPPGGGELALRLGGLAFVCEPAASMPPAWPPWSP